MRNVVLGGVVCAVMVVAVAAGAQDKKMSAMDHMDKNATDKTYTGCLSKTDAGGYSLANPMAADSMKKPMSKDAMMKDGMKDGMAKDGMAKDAMAKDGMAKDAMGKSMMAQPLGLSSTSVDLAKHLGHKVSVTGTAGDTMNGMATFTVKSLKMVASSCS